MNVKQFARLVFEFTIDIFVGMCAGIVGFVSAIFFFAFLGWQTLAMIAISAVLGFLAASAGIMFSMIVRTTKNSSNDDE